jgi:hypothetical protein
VDDDVDEVVATVLDEVEELLVDEEVEVELVVVDELVLDDVELVVGVGPSSGQLAGAGARLARNLVPSSFVTTPPKNPQYRTPPIWTITPSPPCGVPPSG